MRRSAGIERDLVSRADQRVLRWFGHVKKMDEYHMDGWYEGGLGQQRNDSGGCASMRERSERVESPVTYATE